MKSLVHVVKKAVKHEPIGSFLPMRRLLVTVLSVLAVVLAVGLAVWIWDAAQLPTVRGNLTPEEQTDFDLRATQLRVDTIRNVLGAIAGIGALVALFLAIRRQYVQEHVSHRDHQHTAFTEHDAVERRITDLYVKAAEQLGSDKAPVRMAGLYALERLGQDNPEHRQTIVNLLCAYLRMPYELPEDSHTTEVNQERRQEKEVRLTAQRIITKRIKHGSDQYWGLFDIDLNGALLVEADFSDARAGVANFGFAEFHGYFSSFKGFQASEATFDSTTFTTTTAFHSAKFTTSVDFVEARFNKTVTFREMSAHQASFVMTRFYGCFSLKDIVIDELDFRAFALKVTNPPSDLPDGWRFSDVPEGDEELYIIRSVEDLNESLMLDRLNISSTGMIE